MIYHVLPGDSLLDAFGKTGLPGEVIVCREALVEGPVTAEADQFWAERARFILAEFGEDEIEYHENVAGELMRLADLEPDDEVNLWFEYELFCSVNLWFCVDLIADTGAAAYRVEPIGINESSRWEGFAGFGADDLLACYELRTAFAEDDILLGRELWQAYRQDDHTRLRQLRSRDSQCFPHLCEVVAAAIEKELEPLEVIRRITATGETDFERIFAEFKKRAGVYGYGDAQVRRLVDQASSLPSSS